MYFSTYLRICLLGCLAASLSAQSPDPALLESFDFRNLGPTRGGRVTTVTGVVQQPGTFYLGATGGGVWKTDDYGQHWYNVSDNFFASPSIGAIRVAPTNPELIYVGTGSDGLRSNVIAGKGMYRSTDGGRHWEHIGLPNTGHIGAVEVHPQNADLVYVAAIGNAFAPNPERGIYRSRNGGRDWEQVLFLADTIGFADLELAPDDPNTIYAAAWRAERKPWTIISGGARGGIYKSTDGGDNWQPIMTAAIMPSGLIGKIDLAVSADNPDRLYALVEAPQGEGGLYRSDDRGEQWRLVSTHAPLLDRPFYYCNVDANPQNADAVYINSTRFWYSPNAGDSWSRLSTPHGDNHDIWIHPQDTMIWVQANDGGANVSLNGGKSWSTQNNQPTAELYQIEVDDRTPYWIYAGQQDNSTIALPSLPPTYSPAGDLGFWEAVGGCETGPAVPKPGNPHIVYSNCKGRFSVYDRRTGQSRQYYVGAANMYGHNPSDLTYRFQRVSPIHVSPHDPDVVYHASQFVHRTEDDGRTWETISPDLTAFEEDKQQISGSPITRDITGEEFYSTIYALRESPVQAGMIWVGANDGPVHVSRDHGGNWQEVTPPGLAGGGRVDCVEPSPHQAEKAYVCILRYQLGDIRPYLYRTDDAGKSWTLLSTPDRGFPTDQPVRVVREDPERPGLLYAGTEYGLWISFDDGAHWQSFQRDLPVTPVTDLKIHRGDLILSTMGRGFWIMDDLSALRQIADLNGKTAQLLPRPPVTSLRYRSSRGVPEYPAPGVDLYYYLPAAVDSEVQLDIMNAEGQLVRSFTNRQPEAQEQEDEEEEPDMATGFVKAGYSNALSDKPGLHVFRWDMRHSGAWSAQGPSRSRGPRVAPGNYTVRMHIGNQQLEQPLEIRMDPRLQEAGITLSDLQQQEELALRVRNLLSRSRELSAAVANLKSKDHEEQLAFLNEELITEKGRYPQPRFVSQVEYLAGMLNQADQSPGKDAFDRYDHLRDQYLSFLPIWESISGESRKRYSLD